MTVPLPRRFLLPPFCRCRRAEQGASLVLALLVMMVLVVVVSQVYFGAQVEKDHVSNYVEGRRFRLVAEACALEAGAVLMMDLDRDAGGADEAGDDGSSSPGGDLFGGGGGGGDGNDTAADAADVTSSTDSALDEWAHSESLIPSVGTGLTIVIEIVDEDRKLNLLGLWTEDEEEQERYQDAVERLLDEVFTGTSYDFSPGDAQNIVESLLEWVRGTRGTYDPVPKPPLKHSNAEDEADDDSLLFDDDLHFPLTLGELQMVEGIAPVHLWGFVEDDVFFPGLADVLTILSHLEVKPELDDEEGDGASPFDNFGSPDDGGEDEGEEDDSGSGDEGGEGQAQPTNDGLVNLNTAPYVVMRALAYDEIPNAYLEKIVEFRNLIQEYEQDEFGGSSVFDNDADEGDESSPDNDDDEEEDEDDITRFVFEDPANLWDKIQEEFDIEPHFDSDIQNDFTRLFTTSSQVFTIKILIRDDISGRRQSFRTIVWRQQLPEGTRMVTLLPLETFWDPRRLRDFAVDLEQMSDAHTELLGDLASGF